MKRFFVWLAFLAVLFSLCGCGARVPEHVHSVDIAMGTVIQQSLYISDDGTDFMGKIMDLIVRLEGETLSWRLDTSEVYHINQSAGSGKSVQLSQELSRVIRLCLELSEESGGAFDVSLGPVIRLWDIDSWSSDLPDGSYQVPDEQTLRQVLALCGSSRLHVESLTDTEDDECLVLSLEEGVMLDLGAVGKGLALDYILEMMRENPDVSGGTVSVGGSVLTYGTKPDETAWRVGVANPENPSENIGVLYLEGQWCVSTSGDYERYVEIGGVRYHHILDPAIGMPADSGLTSVTIVTKDGLLSDGLSTACFVLGREKGLELAAQYGAEALFVESDGEISMTPGMEGIFHGSSLQ